MQENGKYSLTIIIIIIITAAAGIKSHCGNDFGTIAGLAYRAIDIRRCIFVFDVETDPLDTHGLPRRNVREKVRRERVGGAFSAYG
jgi:hypothetical protein